MLEPNRFTNYDPSWRARFTCPRCGKGADLDRPWDCLTQHPRPRSGGIVPATSPWLVAHQMAITCPACQAGFVVHLDGAGGGRMGEVQYVVAGVEGGGRWWP